MTGIDCKEKIPKCEKYRSRVELHNEKGGVKGLNFAKNASNSGWMVHVSNQTFLKASFALFFTLFHIFIAFCKNPNMIRILLSWKIWNPAKTRGTLQLSDRLVWNEKCKALMKIQKNILPKPKRSKRRRKNKFWGILPAFRSRLFCSSNVPSLDLDSTNFSRKAYPKRSSSQEING